MSECTKCGEHLNEDHPHICPIDDYYQLDNPFWDGTPGAHPAWWRGNDQGVEAVCNIVLDILNKKVTESVGTYGYAKLNEIRVRLLELCKS